MRTSLTKTSAGVWILDRPFGNQRITVRLESGKKYRVIPINPAKKKHRDRIVELIEIIDDFMPDQALVRFLDTNRQGKIVLDDLVPVNEH